MNNLGSKKASLNKYLTLFLRMYFCILLLNLLSLSKVQATIPHDLKIKKHVFSETISEFDNYNLSVEIGKLSKFEFEDLQNQFRSQLKYDPSKNYELIDFLPIFFRKIYGKTLNPYELQVPDVLIQEFAKRGKHLETVTRVDSLCHTLTWQMIYHFQGQQNKPPIFFQVEGDQLQSMIQDSETIEFKNIKIGDTILVEGSGGYQQRSNTLHSMTYVGFGLVAEKANPGVQNFFRIAYLKDVMQKYKTEVANVKFIFKRTSSMTNKIPTPQEALSLKSIKTQRSFQIENLNIPTEIMQKFSIVETWDHVSSRSVFFASPIIEIKFIPKEKIESLPSLQNQKSCQSLLTSH